MYHSISDIIKQSVQEKIAFWEVVLRADMEERGVSYEDSFEMMRRMYRAMRDADAGYDPKVRSASGMAGGAGELLHIYNESGKNICGDFVGEVMEKAIKMGESNACMHRIVAAPTADSGGLFGGRKAIAAKGRCPGRSYVYYGGCWCSYCRECFGCRRIRWLSGGNRLCQCNGGCGTCLFARW